MEGGGGVAFVEQGGKGSVGVRCVGVLLVGFFLLLFLLLRVVLCAVVLVTRGAAVLVEQDEEGERREGEKF